MSDDGQGIAVNSALYGALIGGVYSFLCGSAVAPSYGRDALNTGLGASLGGALSMGIYGAGVGLFIQADKKQSSGDKAEGVREEHCAVGILVGMFLGAIFSAAAGQSSAASRYSRGQQVAGYSSLTVLGGLLGGLIGYYLLGDGSDSGSGSSDGPDWGVVLIVLAMSLALGYVSYPRNRGAGLFAGLVVGILVLLLLGALKKDDPAPSPPDGGGKKVAFRR